MQPHLVQAILKTESTSLAFFDSVCVIQIYIIIIR